jgi:hypothetical protein
MTAVEQRAGIATDGSERPLFGRKLSFSALYCRRMHGLRPLLSESFEFLRPIEFASCLSTTLKSP